MAHLVKTQVLDRASLTGGVVRYHLKHTTDLVDKLQQCVYFSTLSPSEQRGIVDYLQLVEGSSPILRTILVLEQNLAQAIAKKDSAAVQRLSTQLIEFREAAEAQLSAPEPSTLVDLISFDDA